MELKRYCVTSSSHLICFPSTKCNKRDFGQYSFYFSKSYIHCKKMHLYYHHLTLSELGWRCVIGLGVATVRQVMKERICMLSHSWDTFKTEMFSSWSEFNFKVRRNEEEMKRTQFDGTFRVTTCNCSKNFFDWNKPNGGLITANEQRSRADPRS